VSLLNDGVTNAMKFALGLNAQIRGYFGRLSTGTMLDGGQFYNSLTYSRPEPPPAGNVYTVKTGSNLGAWSDTETLEIANTVAGGLRTIIIRDTISSSVTAPRRFIRLEVVVP
jgi:hypothetical protein